MKSIFRSFLIASGILAAFSLVQPAVHAQGMFGGAFSTFFSKDADEDEEESPIDISASSADIDFENNLITLLENVVVDRTDVKITCDKMEIFLKEEKEDDSEEEKDKTAGSASKPEAAPAAVPASGPAAKNDGDDEKKSKKDKDDNGMNQNISKIVCSRNVVYRQQKSGNSLEDSLALAAKGDYDEATGVIVMTGGHMNPKEELSEAMYNDIVRVVGKDMIQEYPILKQGADWVLGDKIEILGPKHIRIINPKATRSNKAASSGNTRTGSAR